jgi:hypothetical protein
MISIEYYIYQIPIIMSPSKFTLYPPKKSILPTRFTTIHSNHHTQNSPCLQGHSLSPFCTIYSSSSLIPLKHYPPHPLTLTQYNVHHPAVSLPSSSSGCFSPIIIRLFLSHHHPAVSLPSSSGRFSPITRRISQRQQQNPHPGHRVLFSQRADRSLQTISRIGTWATILH